jgi:hypothetical protein
MQNQSAMLNAFTGALRWHGVLHHVMCSTHCVDDRSSDGLLGLSENIRCIQDEESNGDFEIGMHANLLVK